MSMADAAANYDQQTADAYYASDAVQKEMRQAEKKRMKHVLKVP
jgi:hypothetical protein